MKICKQRTAFGSEQRLIQYGTERCASCGVLHGVRHKPGCEAEECPQCRCMVIGCACDCLSTYDGAAIIQGLYRRFESLGDALGDLAGRIPAEKISYLEHAAVQYIFENVSQDVRDALISEFRKKYPDLIPHLQDQEGTPYYTAEQLSQSLDIPLQEVQERIDAMVEAGGPVRFSQPADLKKNQ